MVVFRILSLLVFVGKAGSGVTTTADILKQDFESLKLPEPGFSNADIYREHEYRLLYTYAKKNWKRFYKVKVSALITRHIMQEKEEKFCDFLEDLGVKSDKEKILECVSRFFEAKMTIKLQDYAKYIEIAPADKEVGYKWLMRDVHPYEFQDEIDRTSHIKIDGMKVTAECSLTPECKVEFEYDKETTVCTFRNRDLSKIVDCYAEKRRRKSGFNNVYLYWMLEKYIYEFLPLKVEELWDDIIRLSSGAHIIALQCLGNNLRIAKKPYWDNKKEEFEVDGYTYIAEDINLAIKILRASQYNAKMQSDTSENLKTVVVIDSIKNPYESLYLKRRYSNYFLMGIYTEDEERHCRMRDHKPRFTEAAMEMIDTIEQVKELEKDKKECGVSRNLSIGEKQTLQKMFQYLADKCDKMDLNGILSFVSQNILECLESADIFINNVRDNDSHLQLKYVLLRYVCLIMNPGLVLPTPIERCMQIASVSKLNSGCISRQVGAVITDAEYHLLSVGWNRQPERQLPCSYRDLCEVKHHWSPQAYSDYENNDQDEFQKGISEMTERIFDQADNPLAAQGKLPCFCFKDIYNSIVGNKNQVHTRALHAEETAFMSLGETGTRLAEGGILFTTSSPCELCSKKAQYMKIKTIYYIQLYAGLSHKHILSCGAVEERPNFVLFTGAIGETYMKLYKPAISHKDENELWLGAKMDKDLYCNLILKRKSQPVKCEENKLSDKEEKINGREKTSDWNI